MLKYLTNNPTIIILIVILLLIVILGYRYYEERSHFRNLSETPSGYELFAGSNNTTSLVFGNPLINRNGENLEITNFGMNSDKMNLILNSNGSGLTALANNGTIKINLQHPYSIVSLRITGLFKFNIMYSSTDNNDYKNAVSSSSSSIYFVNPNPSQTLTFENMLDANNMPLVARYIKIINIDVNNANNVKLELYGLPTGSNTKGILQAATSINTDLFDEKNVAITTGVYKAEPSNQIPHLTIRMPGNIDYLINFITIKSNFSDYQIKYGNSQELTSIYTIPCNGNINGNVNSNIAELFYFPNPTLLNYIDIYPKKRISNVKQSKPFEITEIAVYGNAIDPTTNKAPYIASSRTNCKESFKSVGSNNSISRKFKLHEDFADLSDPYTNNDYGNLTDTNILTNIKTTQNLCNILEYQDQVSSEKVKVEKNKQYLIKLQEQTDEIAKLEALITNLKEEREKRIDSNDSLNLARLQKQKGEAAKLTDLVKQRLASQEKLNLNVNLVSAPISVPEVSS